MKICLAHYYTRVAGILAIASALSAPAETPPAAAVDLVEFSSQLFLAQEKHTHAKVVINRLRPSANTITVNLATANGTAVAGDDYLAPAVTVQMTPEQKRVVVEVPLLDDAIIETKETINLTLSAPTAGATLGPKATATILIIDDDRGGNVQFRSPFFQVIESGGAATITVVRSGGKASGAKVGYSTSDGSAGAQDYVATSGTLTFGAGETFKTFQVPILPDTLSERTETVNLKLTSLDGTTRIVGKRTSQLSIIDPSGIGKGKGHGKFGKIKGPGKIKGDDDDDDDDED